MKRIALIVAAALLIAALPFTACKGKEEKISRYDIDVTFDAADGSLTGTAAFDFYNSTPDAVEKLKFNLWGNAYRKDADYAPVQKNDDKAYYGGVSYGSERVERVEGGASWEIAGEDENLLEITLAQPCYPGERAAVSIYYTLSLARINHRTGITPYTVNLGNFYPVLCAYSEGGFAENPYYACGDPFLSDCADYAVTLTLPKQYVAATSGEELSRTVAGELATARYSLKNARDFAAVISDKFKVAERRCGGCDVKVYYTSAEEPEGALDAACDSLSFYGERFGEYAYPTLSVAFTPLSVSGMEYPALTMVSDSLEGSEIAYTVAHENAHQWWYAMVGSDQVNCAWQDEGLAEYSTLCFFEGYPAYGYTRTGILGSAIKAYRAYYSVYNQIFGKSDTSMNRSLKDFDGDYEYVNIAYNKGILAFESVRTAMGDGEFFAALKDYFGRYKFGFAPYEGLVGAFAAKKDVEGLIMGYVDGKVVI